MKSSFKTLLVLLALGFVIGGCRKSSPTAYMRAYSIFYRDPLGSSSWHQFTMSAVSPNFKPDVKFNGRSIPSENVDVGFGLGDFVGYDTLPTISPNAEVQLEAKYRDLNEKEKTAKSKVKLPSEPSVSVKITGDVIRVAWGKPDKKTVSFVYVGITAYCYDGSKDTTITEDTIITDIENVTEFSKTKGTMCVGMSNPIFIYAYGFVGYFYGPWSGSKDNIDGIKGQFYGATGLADTTSWILSSSAKFERKPSLNREEILRRAIKAINERFGASEEGNWINGF